MSDQRRGKIARLPRSVRDQLNVRLDDGHDADQILPWLNDLPEVREVLAKQFNGAPVSPQNLSGWRQGGFQEWLLHRQYIDSAIHMTEHVERLDDEFSNNPYGTYRTLADYMITQISIRMAGALVRWENDGKNIEMNMLLKLGQFVIKLQKAAHLAERQALEIPRLRRKAEDEDIRQRLHGALFRECGRKRQHPLSVGGRTQKGRCPKTAGSLIPTGSPIQASKG
jgi:hypothetical protein